MSTPEYKVTTDYKAFKSWLWFQEYLVLLKTAPPPKDAGALPVALGEAFCKWVLDTPEIRDIIYRGYILRIVEDELEESLLGLANVYFLLRNDISESNGGLLTPCWHVLTQILRGELSPPPNEDVRERLLRSSWAFKK